MAETRKPAYVRDIEAALKIVRPLAYRLEGQNPDEAKTRKQLIDPILGALRWDVDNLEQVVTDPNYYIAGGGYPDYALFRSKTAQKPVVVPVEAKRLKISNLHRYYKQLRGYAKGLESRAGYGVVTDGDQWRIFNWNNGQRYGGNLAHKISIRDDATADCVDALKVLRRRNTPWPGL